MSDIRSFRGYETERAVPGQHGAVANTNMQGPAEPAEGPAGSEALDGMDPNLLADIRELQRLSLLARRESVRLLRDVCSTASTPRRAPCLYALPCPLPCPLPCLAAVHDRGGSAVGVCRVHH